VRRWTGPAGWPRPRAGPGLRCPASRPGTGGGCSGNWRPTGACAFVCVQPALSSWARRSEDLTTDKTDEKDAVLIARLTASCVATCPNRWTRPGVGCGIWVPAASNSSWRPHPGAQLSLFDSIEGLRHQVFITDTPRPACSVQLLELRHRAHARVEDRIRCAKDAGLGRFPSRLFAINAAWLELALIAADLLAWSRVLLLDGDHAIAEPKRLRYRLMHVAARIVRTARRTYLRIAERWPWAEALTAAFARLAALPRPAV
jgi:hypothetical protein